MTDVVHNDQPRKPVTATTASNEWGADDELGAANLMTETSKRHSLQRIKHGNVYHLGVPVTPSSPAWADRHHHIRLRQIHEGHGEGEITILDDFLDMSVGIGTHIDTLAHVAVRGELYNGHRMEDVFDKDNGALKLGIDKISSFLTRCVILDIAGIKNVDVIPGGTVITVRDIQDALRKQGDVTIARGDIVCLHTGWIKYYQGTDEEQSTFQDTEPGIGREAATWFVEQGVVMVVADNWGLEVHPKEEGEVVNLPVHRTLIKEHGVYIGEMFDLRQVVRDAVSVGTMVIQLVRNKGTVQARCNPQIFV